MLKPLTKFSAGICGKSYKKAPCGFKIITTRHVWPDYSILKRRRGEAEMGNVQENAKKQTFSNSIKDQILSGRLNPGDRLPPERELAEEYGISRGSVNQGILDLERIGFLKVIPRKGTFVADYVNFATPDTIASVMGLESPYIDKRLFADYMDMRILIERECVRLSCENMNKENMSILTAAVSEVFSCTDENFTDALYNFHQSLTRTSGNRAYVMTFKSFEKMIKTLIEQHYSSLEERNRVMPLYSELSVAMIYGNSEKADELITEILTTASRYLEELDA